MPRRPSSSIAEELGEAVEAWIGLTGGNPRKGVYKTKTDVLDELADVILAAAVPMTDIAGGPERAAEVLAARLRHVSARAVLGDSQGSVPAPSSTPSSDGWHATYIAVHVLLLDASGKALMLRRANTGYRDGWLNPPAGRIEPGEDVLTATIREAREEAGIDLDPHDAEFVHIMHPHLTVPSWPVPRGVGLLVRLAELDGQAACGRARQGE